MAFRLRGRVLVIAALGNLQGKMSIAAACSVELRLRLKLRLDGPMMFGGANGKRGQGNVACWLAGLIQGLMWGSGVYRCWGTLRRVCWNGD